MILDVPIPSWPFCKKFFLIISKFVVAESSQGHPEAAARRLTAIEKISELDVTKKVRQRGRALVAD